MLVWEVKNPENVNKVKIDLGLKLSHLLGFSRRLLEGKEKLMATSKPRISGDIDHLMVYSDIVEPVRVGREYLRLLRMVPVPNSASYNDNIHVEFDEVLYMPITKARFDTIHISISSAEGVYPINFQNKGDVTVVLAFRIKPPYTSA